jgi:hypothetical protein
MRQAVDLILGDGALGLWIHRRWVNPAGLLASRDAYIFRFCRDYNA